jgi:DNA-binding MarR family transcriptional regulator
MNVQDMNNEKHDIQDTYKSLLLLDEISKGEQLSQRDLSKKFNIALGLVNSYIKNLVSKGYITIKAIPAKRYAYYLTPKGFAEKTRLTYHLLQDFTNLYKNARRDFRQLFYTLYAAGVRKVVFAGVDEAAEIAYLSLQEFDIEFAGIVDDKVAGKIFFRHKIKKLDEIGNMQADYVIVSTFLRRDEVFKKLIQQGISSDKIKSVFQIAGKSFRKL